MHRAGRQLACLLAWVPACLLRLFLFGVSRKVRLIKTGVVEGVLVGVEFHGVSPWGIQKGSLHGEPHVDGNPFGVSPKGVLYGEITWGIL